jgi:hypothetical protein
MILGEKTFYGRRSTVRSVGTSLDPIQDMISWVGYLVSTEYTAICLEKVHGFGPGDAAIVAGQVTHHAKMAQSLLKKSVESLDETGYLDGYYGILNLMKIYVLFSNNFAELPQNKLHGITFKPCDETSNNFQSDIVILKRSGTMSLFYKTLTGNQVTADIPIKLGDILPWLSGTSYEYDLSNGSPADFLYFNVNKDEIGGKYFGCLNLLNADGRTVSEIRSLPLLGKLVEHPTKPFWFLGRESTREEWLTKLAPDLVVPEYCYRNSSGYYCTPLHIQTPKMVQELPIALFFFAMSSIIRYFPSYAYALMNSKWAPLLFASRRHSLLEFLILFWSHIQKEDFYLNEG